MIKILIVDDSETEIQILKHIFAKAPDIEIIGYANNGRDAIYLANKLKPDLITMDIQMPIMDGIQAIRHIMSQQPIPIIVISSKLNTTLSNLTFDALEAGALSVLDKPTNITSPNFEQTRARIIDAVRSLAEIKVIKRRFFIKDKTPISSKIARETISNDFVRNYELVAIGVSVGGPQVLKLILSGLPADFPLPIAIVQHMTKGFMTDFTKWLNRNTAITVKEAVHLESMQAGTVYFAPDNFHLIVDKLHEHLIAKLIDTSPISGFRPSATVLFNSVAKICGPNTIGILLTGMGNDGAEGLLALKQAGGHTIIQDEESSVVFGMAGAAQALGAVDKVLNADKIADYLMHITKKIKIS